MSRFDPAQAAARLPHPRRLRAFGPAPAGQVVLDGRIVLNASGNDYLGLARHPLLAERSAAWGAEFGTGAGASRLVSGTLAPHEAVEARMARFKRCEAALLFASGWQANASVLPALFAAADRPLVFADRLNHASLHHGCAAAGVRQIRYRHNDPGHLDDLLTARAGEAGTRFILTESVFSMDGDQADISALAALAARHDAFLYVDEAHATGVLGEGGAGLCAGVAGIGCVIGTFSKAFGSFGAYVAGSRGLRDLLVGACSGFIHTTALPPPVLGAIDAALDLMPGLGEARARLQHEAARLRTALAGLGIDTAGSTTQIVPAVLGGAEQAVLASERLLAEGVLAVAIRPPTVPNGASRIRLALSAVHGAEQVSRLIGLLPRTFAQDPPPPDCLPSGSLPPGRTAP